MSTTIVVDSQTVVCWVCPKCGARIYPETDQQAHEERHQRLEREFSEAKKTLRPKVLAAQL